ncbi:hypothetical protein SSPS47_28530 [Streptomyces sp. S4.7]|nr:hypothetical protein SSPS47_28530 [Streptomyces sp. S4.7]
MRWLERKTVRPFGGQRAHQLAYPAHPVRVETVDGLVEDEDARVAEQGSRDAEPLVHAERERPGALAGHRRESHQLQDLVHPAHRNTVAAGLRRQMPACGARRVQGLRVQQRADLAHGTAQRRVRPAVDESRAGGRVVESEDHAHGGRLAGPVRAEETGHPAFRDVQCQTVHGDGAAVAFGQPSQGDHVCARPSSGDSYLSFGRYESPVRAHIRRSSAITPPTFVGDPAVTLLGTLRPW